MIALFAIDVFLVGHDQQHQQGQIYHQIDYLRSRQFKEQGEEFVLLHCVGKVQVWEGRKQVDQVPGSYDNTRSFLLAEVMDILLEGLQIGGVCCSESACEDVVAAGERLFYVSSVPNVKYSLQFYWFLMDAMEINLYLELLISCKETAPVGLQVLVLHVLFLALASVDVEDVPDLINLVLLFVLVVVVVGEGVDGWGERVGVGLGLGLAGLCSCVLLALSLVSQLIVDIGKQTRNFIVIDENCYLTFSIPQFLSLQLHLLPRPYRLRQGLILHQHVGPLGRQLVPLDLQVAYESEPREKRGEVLFIGELWVIANGGIQYWNQMFFDFVLRVVADHVESFKMVCEEDLEVVVVGLMECGVDVMVVRTGIGCVLDLEVLHEDEVFDHLHVLDLAVLPEEGTDRLLPRLVQSTHVKLSDQDALMDLLP